jgi:hypothetical protein
VRPSFSLDSVEKREFLHSRERILAAKPVEQVCVDSVMFVYDITGHSAKAL